MISLHSILALEQYGNQLPLIAFIMSAALLVMAFVIGYNYGFRKIGWGGIVWIVSGGLFLLLNGLLHDLNPLLSIDFVQELNEGVQSFISSFSIALVCIAITLTIHGFLAAALRPKLKLVEREDYPKYKYGFELESDLHDYDDYGPPLRLEWVNGGTPTFWGSVIGGLVLFFSTLLVVALLLSAGLIVIEYDAAVKEQLADLLALSFMIDWSNFASSFVLDFLSIGIIIFVAMKGSKNGLVGSLRSLLVVVGGIGAAVLSFWLPFSEYAVSVPFVAGIIEKFGGVTASLGELFAPIAAKLLTGVSFFLVAVIILMIANVVLTQLSAAVRGAEPIRVLDEVLACFFYLIVGVAICFGIWALLFVLDECDMFNVHLLFNDDASLAKGFYACCEQWIKPLIEKLIGV